MRYVAIVLGSAIVGALSAEVAYRTFGRRYERLFHFKVIGGKQ